MFLLAFSVSSSCWAGIFEAQAAYERGDYATALNELRPLAEQGNAHAQASLGWMYTNGHGVPQDDAEAAKWYLLAAEQGDAFAQYMLPEMYAKGDRVPEDDVKAVKRIRLAAEQGNAEAQFKLGTMYRKGDSVRVRHRREHAAPGPCRA
jgi:uncharacterized protein